MATNLAARTSGSVEPEIPLDLTKRQPTASSALSPAGVNKRKSSDSDDSSSPPLKKASTSLPVSAIQTATAISPGSSPSLHTSLPVQLNGAIKPLKADRPIYRCESCCIPFYKKDVYEAHKMHYCSQRSSNGLDHTEELKTAKLSERIQTPPTTTADERLVITYTCNKCSTSYRTIETFTAHQCSVPTTARPGPVEKHKCDLCNFVCQSKQVFQEHLDSHQKANVVFKCSLCGYHGNTMRGMRQHGRQHLLQGEEFVDADIVSIEVPAVPQKVIFPASVLPIPTHKPSVDEELLRLKNEPYKKRRSRKHYQKSEYILPSSLETQISPQRKENAPQRPSSTSSHSNQSSHSLGSPLQNSSCNVPHKDMTPSPPPAAVVAVKQDPAIIPTTLPTVVNGGVGTISEKKSPPTKNHVCSCNASFASLVTFEAHKKHYCPHNKSKQNSSTITVTH